MPKTWVRCTSREEIGHHQFFIIILADEGEGDAELVPDVAFARGWREVEGVPVDRRRGSVDGRADIVAGCWHTQLLRLVRDFAPTLQCVPWKAEEKAEEQLV